MDPGFVAPGVPVGAMQPSYVNTPRNPDRSWLKSMWPQWGSKEAEIMPANAEFATTPPAKR
jgi:hypothetical protein